MFQATTGSMPGQRWVFTPCDAISLAFAAFGLEWAVVAVLKVQPSFAAAFTDFGSTLPAFTELCLRPWLPISSALVPLAISGAGVVSGATLNVRMLLMGLTIFLTLTLPGVLMYGIYLPVFEIANAIK